MPRGLSDKELDKLAKAGLFPQAPGTRGPNNPHSPWFDASLVPDTTKAAAILGKERASDLMRRGWRFWGKP